MNATPLETALARYINFKNALSIAMTICLSILMSNIEAKSIEDIMKYMIIIIILFVIWICVYSIEKGGSSFITWLGNFLTTRQENNKNSTSAAVSDLINNLRVTEKVEVKKVNIQVPPPYAISHESNGYQKPPGG